MISKGRAVKLDDAEPLDGALVVEKAQEEEEEEEEVHGASWRHSDLENYRSRATLSRRRRPHGRNLTLPKAPPMARARQRGDSNKMRPTLNK